MRLFSSVLVALFVSTVVFAGLSAAAQIVSSGSQSLPPTSASGPSIAAPGNSGSTLTLGASSTMTVASEMGGAFKSGSKCDSDGNLYIRKFALDRPLLGPVVKIDPDGKRTALFDPAAFSQLALHRADGFSPAFDGGIYLLAQTRAPKPGIYVLHFSSDGTPSSSTLLDADFEVNTFAAFAGGNLLVSGVRRDLQNDIQNKDTQSKNVPTKNARGRNFTAVFSADGRELAELSFPSTAPPEKVPARQGKAATQNNAPTKSAIEAEEYAPTLDLSQAEVGVDGNLYVLRASSPAIIYVIAPGGKIARTLKIAGPTPSAVPNEFHLSANRLALSFWSGESQTIVVADAQTGQTIASYSDPTGLAPSFACYSADEGVFTFLKLGEGNELKVIRAEAQ